MMKVLVIGGCAALLWLGVVRQNVVTVNTARAKELAYAPAVASCVAAERAALVMLRDGAMRPELARELVQACDKVQEGADRAQLRRMAQ